MGKYIVFEHDYDGAGTRSFNTESECLEYLNDCEKREAAGYRINGLEIIAVVKGVELEMQKKEVTYEKSYFLKKTGEV